MATLTINHYINQSNSFIADIRNNRNAYYMFAARPQPWANSSGGNDDSANAVLASNNSVSQVEQVVYNNILFGKLLKDEDVINVVPRYDWTSNTVYQPYDQTDADLYDKQFYVVTDKYEVYKCIDNNNGAPSTVKPSLTSASGTFKTGDGYLWKYMYTIDSTSNTKFTTTDYIPVATNTAVQGNATPGSIDLIKITDGGSGYSVYETGYIAGVTNRFTIQLPISSSNTDDYYVNSSIYLKSGFGAGQIREIFSSNGTSKQIILNEPIETFTQFDLANISGTVATGYFVDQPFDDINYLRAQGYYNIDSTVAQSDTGASGKVLSSNTTMIQVTRLNTNTSFQLGFPIVDVSQSGSIKTGTVSVGNVGSCNLAFVANGGSGYTTNPTVAITPTGLTGSGATANALVNTSGKVSAINITAAGNGYFTAPTIAISAPTAQTFNANTSVTAGANAGSNNIITLGASLAVTANTTGVSNTADVLLITNANTFLSTNDLVYYSVPTGNTAIPNLIGNTFYYVSFANQSSIALSTTLGGPNVDIAETRAVAGQTHRIISGTAHRFVANDVVTYTKAAGNTSNIGLVANTSYFIEFANQTVIALKSTPTGSRIALTKGATESGHIIQGQTATGNVFCDNQIVVGSGTQLNTAANGYFADEYIRVGANTTSNIRRVINSVNTTVLVVASPFNTSFNATANQHFKMPMAAEPSSIVIQGANGYVTDTNLTSRTLLITNSSLSGVTFTVGEKVNMTDSSKVNQGANAIIAFANTSTVILSSVQGVWSISSGGTQFFVSGESSLQLSQISSVASNPNITLEQTNGIFKLGYPVTFKLTSNSAPSGNAIVVGQISLPNDRTEYQIGPSVRITGDGANALGVAVVNTATNSVNEIIGVDMISPGTGYTQANVVIYSNTSYGSGATARAIISPVKGHGFDAVTELGARYVGVTAKFNSPINESYEFPGYGEYRQAGILENPQFKDLTVTLKDFDRANFVLNTASYSSSGGGWTAGEVVVQSSTNAGGVVVYGNNSFLQLKSVKGTFAANNTLTGYFSNTTANVNSTEVIRFPVGNAAAFITQSNSGSTGVITAAVSNTVYMLSNVVGQFADGDIMYDTVANAYATVDTIYTANNTKDVSASFGGRFNQTARITLTSSSGEFLPGEFVQQEVSLASGRVVSYTDELDLLISSVSGSFFVGQTITDTTTNANGTCIFANSSYVKLSAISQNLSFANNDTISNGLGSTATISGINRVLVLNDVSDVNNFQAGSNVITGSTSGATGICNNHLLIRNPDLVRDSGKLIYSESFTPVTRSPTSMEEIKLVIKF